MWKVWLSLIVAVWMVLAGVAGVTTGGNFIISGVLLTIFGFLAGGWRGGLIGLLGIWTVVSGFVPSLLTPGNLVVTGLIATILAIWKRVVMGRSVDPTPYPR